jgi:hypothetical protein
MYHSALEETSGINKHGLITTISSLSLKMRLQIKLDKNLKKKSDMAELKTAILNDSVGKRYRDKHFIASFTQSDRNVQLISIVVTFQVHIQKTFVWNTIFSCSIRFLLEQCLKLYHWLSLDSQHDALLAIVSYSTLHKLCK